MISLLGTLMGFGTSIIPEILGYFKQKQADAHQLEMLAAQAQYAEQLSKLKVQELDAQAEIEETKGLYAHDRSIDSGKFSAIVAFWFGNRAMSKARAWQIEKKQA